MSVLNYWHQSTSRRDGTSSALRVAAPVVCSMVPALFVLWQAATRLPVNHWDLDVRWFVVIPATGMLWTVVAAAKGAISWRHTAITISVSLLAIALIWGTDYFNVLVNYDVWISRGMPDPWQP